MAFLDVNFKGVVKLLESAMPSCHKVAIVCNQELIHSCTNDVNMSFLLSQLVSDFEKKVKE